jgi:hypothetical protein
MVLAKLTRPLKAPLVGPEALERMEGNVRALTAVPVRIFDERVPPTVLFRKDFPLEDFLRTNMTQALLEPDVLLAIIPTGLVMCIIELKYPARHDLNGSVEAELAIVQKHGFTRGVKFVPREQEVTQSPREENRVWINFHRPRVALELAVLDDVIPETDENRRVLKVAIWPAPWAMQVDTKTPGDH